MKRPRRRPQKEEIQVPVRIVKLSWSIQFLNSINPTQALQFYNEMVKKMKCVERINPRHINPRLTNTDELKKMIGHQGQNGKFY